MPWYVPHTPTLMSTLFLGKPNMFNPSIVRKYADIQHNRTLILSRRVDHRKALDHRFKAAGLVGYTHYEELRTYLAQLCSSRNCFTMQASQNPEMTVKQAFATRGFRMFIAPEIEELVRDKESLQCAAVLIQEELEKTRIELDRYNDIPFNVGDLVEQIDYLNCLLDNLERDENMRYNALKK